ncbi:MAG: CRP-like cAMP-binding protein [Myxococcota bacterium]|jgi:CRP-like cAMP-binding protein
MNHNIFRRLSSVSNFSPALLKELVEVTGTPFSVGADEVLLAEGEQDDAFMIIVEGELDVIVGKPPVVIAQVGPGAMLGEMAIFGLERKRRATVVTRTPTVGVIFQRDGIELLRQRGHVAVTRLEGQAVHAAAARLREMNERFSALSVGTGLEPVAPGGLLARLRSWLGFSHSLSDTPMPDVGEVLRSSPLFGTLPDHAIATLAEALRPVSVADGDIILEEATYGRDAYIVATGRIGVYRAVRNEKNERIADLMPGDVFGLVGLLHGASRTATCIAEEPSWLLHLSADVYNALTLPSAPGATYLHRAIYEAQAGQLDNANQRVAQLIAALAGVDELDGDNRAIYHEFVSGSL